MQQKYIMILFLMLSMNAYAADASDQDNASECDSAKSRHKACLLANEQFWPQAVYKNSASILCAVQYFAMIKKCREAEAKMRKSECQSQNEE